MKNVPVIFMAAGLMIVLQACAPAAQLSAAPSAAPSAVPSASLTAPSAAAAASSPAAATSPAASGTAVSIPSISPAEAKKRIDAHEKLILLDVRTEEEYKRGHIPGSWLLPVGSIETDALKQLKDKDAVIFVYCRSGRRSKIAAEALIRMGYTQVYDLGGINDWPYAVTTY